MRQNTRQKSTPNTNANNSMTKCHKGGVKIKETNNEESYIKMIKEHNYNKMILNNSHRFYKEREKKISSKLQIIFEKS